MPLEEALRLLNSSSKVSTIPDTGGPPMTGGGVSGAGGALVVSGGVGLTGTLSGGAGLGGLLSGGVGVAGTLSGGAPVSEGGERAVTPTGPKAKSARAEPAKNCTASTSARKNAAGLIERNFTIYVPGLTRNVRNELKIREAQYALERR
jgi:hypothetical protein